MFNKEETIKDELKTSKTIIGPSVKIEGDFNSDENIEIEGHVSGTIKTTKDLSIGEGAKIVAEVEANNIFISGEIKGNVVAKEKCELSNSAKINGNVTTNIISIESGASINGQCNSGNISENATEKNSRKKNNKDSIGE